jgi:hypothetical protein
MCFVISILPDMRVIFEVIHDFGEMVVMMARDLPSVAQSLAGHLDSSDQPKPSGLWELKLSAHLTFADTVCPA